MKSRKKKEKTEGATGLGRRIIREQIARWNQMTALRFLTAGKTSEESGLPSGQKTEEFKGGF